LYNCTSRSRKGTFRDGRVLALPELALPCMVQAAIPIGDGELLAQLRARLADVNTRAAGATCPIDATTES
jgi:hypothetical protein